MRTFNCHADVARSQELHAALGRNRTHSLEFLLPRGGLSEEPVERFGAADQQRPSKSTATAVDSGGDVVQNAPQGLLRDGELDGERRVDAAIEQAGGLLRRRDAVEQGLNLGRLSEDADRLFECAIERLAGLPVDLCSRGGDDACRDNGQ